MFSGDKRKNIFIGAGAALALIGAAIAYQLLTGEEEENENSAIQKKLKAVGLAQVKRTPDEQMLDPDYTVRLLNFITKTAK